MKKLRVRAPILKFKPVSPADLGLIVPTDQALGQAWKAADNKHAFTITRECDSDDANLDPFFTVHVSQSDGSYRRRIRRKFKTFDAAVQRCSTYTRVARRQVAYHEAGHAVIAWLLGCSGVWVTMDDGAYRAITRHDTMPLLLAVADGSYAALARVLYEELMISVAGLVAEVKIAGYPTGYAEEDIAGRASIAWDAVRVARLESGLPICGHMDCEIPLGVDEADRPGRQF
jgi:hypothetical protein